MCILFDAYEEAMYRAAAFHKSVPGYAATPLYEMEALAYNLGIGGLVVKDEGVRFEQGSFKVLGSTFALAAHFFEKVADGTLDFSSVKNIVQQRPPRIFATATDGNHGRGLAWTAKLFNQHAKVYLPKGASRKRLEIVQALGAEAEITDRNYDCSVQFVKDRAAEEDWIVAQDTAWEGYTTFPSRIMQGYLTIVAEVLEQIQEKRKPTHLILQAGVGSFAGAIAGLCKQIFGDEITIVIVEPAKADCLYQSALAEDGQARKTSGDLTSDMKGLACGEVNPLAWDILKTIADVFVTCPDSVAVKGMHLLGQSMENDPKIVAGEAGAVSLGLLNEISKNEAFAALKEYIGLNGDAQVLLVNTESKT
ncbi:diaminopropionate ammonia-lyase [Salicibibacter halophilus]|uniref:Diaminopropionate ammonia-lyase n=1 Tax=Salicibibacter halophilus TaxID=2502791 RepID=A0A514LKM3_9BACI|nr:diaminopropionate ammonia-lyase [Salicibibacter halophilus]QDI92353.1 diaminopropionate ammonia-lyase [Salicibibacter halophilus]